MLLLLPPGRHAAGNARHEGRGRRLDFRNLEPILGNRFGQSLRIKPNLVKL
jgi:hypothetical protein